MHYAYSVLVLPSNDITNPAKEMIHFQTGVIKHVSIAFPPGPARMVSTFINHGAEKWLPLIPNQVYTEDNYTIEIDCYHPIPEGSNLFTIIAWNVGCSYQHRLNYYFTVQSPEEPDEYMAIMAMAQSVYGLAQLMRSWS
jgi:hypothetical protein